MQKFVAVLKQQKILGNICFPEQIIYKNSRWVPLFKGRPKRKIRPTYGLLCSRKPITFSFLFLFFLNGPEYGQPFVAKFKYILFSFMDLYLYSTNNTNSTSTPYSYFHSTQIFFQLQVKLFYFNQKMSIQLLYLKFPDIPNVYQQKLTVPSQIRRTFDTPTQSLGMRSQRHAGSNSTE